MPSSGAFVLGLDTFVNHRKHADEQVRLKREVESVWVNGLEDERSICDRDLREIQSGIYRLRVVAPPVPDDFYWSKRDDMEQQMQLAAQRMKAEVEAAQRTKRGAEDR